VTPAGPLLRVRTDGLGNVEQGTVTALDPGTRDTVAVIGIDAQPGQLGVTYVRAPSRPSGKALIR
jgi:hypothetical protein